jgi:colanic acid/amylovoran biosynthesis glycosyltransferase
VRATVRVATLVRRFPELSETFILNQITGVLDQGVDLEVFAWGSGDLSTAHPDVEAYSLMRRVRYIQAPAERIPRVVQTASALLKGRAWLRPAVIARSLGSHRHDRSSSSLFLLHAAASFLSGPPHDLMHCQFGRLGLTGLALRKVGAFQGRIVVAFRGSDLSRHRETEGYEALFREGDLFLPVCDAFRTRLVSMGCDPARIRVHHSGIDLRRFTVGPRVRQPSEPFRLITIARLVEKKGVEYAIRAVGELVREGHSVEYIVIGEGPLREELERLAGELGLQAEVRFLGPRDHDDVIRHLEASHVLLAPSVTAESGDQEGIPNVLKEAMATGIPVVSTYHSGIPELVEDGVSGFLVPERTVEPLADRLRFLVDHPDRWGSMGQAGRARVEAAFDSRRLSGELVQLYRELLSPGPRSETGRAMRP